MSEMVILLICATTQPSKAPANEDQAYLDGVRRTENGKKKEKSILGIKVRRTEAQLMDLLREWLVWLDWFAG